MVKALLEAKAALFVRDNVQLCGVWLSVPAVWPHTAALRLAFIARGCGRGAAGGQGHPGRTKERYHEMNACFRLGRKSNSDKHKPSIYCR